MGVGQQTFENKKFVDIPQQCFALLPQGNFPAHNLNSLMVKVIGSNPGYLLESFLFTYVVVIFFLKH